jgi:cellulose synthase/poly-beta-1,6-N-acetylglucosamine synthase-like glycosyltransferase
MDTSPMMLVFWCSVLLITYTYVMYPIMVWGAAKCRPFAGPRIACGRQPLPMVSICIASRNEAGRLPGKIANLLSQDYPANLLEIIIASDGSTDATLVVARSMPGVVVLDCPSRGKAAALNAAVAAARGSILVFTDVRQTLGPDALSILVDRLRDASVGVAGGELVHAPAGTGPGASIGLYWRYEKAIRRAESELFSTLGASGALYALRRADFTPLREGTLLDDFEVPMAVLRTGRRIVLESRAKAYDVVESTLAGERRRKIRTLAGNWQSLANNPWLLAPWDNPACWQYLSHKLFRLLVPYAMLAALIAAWLASGRLYRSAAILQSVFWAVALLGSCLPAFRRLRIISFASLLLELNWAAVAGLLYFCSRRTGALWRTAPAGGPGS